MDKGSVNQDCSKAHVMISDWLSGELSHKEMLQLLDHLKECPACSNYRWEMERTWVLMEEWQAPELPEGLEQRFEERFNKEFGKKVKSEPTTLGRFVEWWKPVWGTLPGVLAGSFAVLMVVSIFFKTPENKVEQISNTAMEKTPESIEVAHINDNVLKDEVKQPVEVADSSEVTDNFTEASYASSSNVPSSWIPVESAGDTVPVNEVGIYVEDPDTRGSNVRTVQYVINPNHSGPVVLILPQKSGDIIEN